MKQNVVSVPYSQTPAKERYPLYAEQVLGGGACRSIGRLLNRLQERNNISDTSIKEVLYAHSFQTTKRYTYLKLVMVTPEQMELLDGGQLQAIENEAKKHDLHLLPMDTAPFLMLQLRSGQLSAHPSIVVASEPVVLSDSPLIFEVNKSQLQTISGAPTAYFKKDQPFLFRRL